MKNRKLKYWILGLLVIATIAIVLHSCNKKSQHFTFTTAVVKKGSVSNTVTATGTLQAILTVDVGTQVSGVIKKLYVDYNSVVKKGEVLAEIDKVPLIANIDDANATLANAQAEVTYNEANYKRIKALFDKQLVAQSDFDQATFNYNIAKATLKTAQVKYDKAKIDLDYATIYSPINGVVLNRAVNEGQTVAASFSTPTLFTIANDLTQMEVAANVDEADIGQVKLKQKVEFNVDAYPDLTFNGIVTEIRLQPLTTSNVVTYTVIVKAPNPELKLMPGMTANITIIVNRSSNILILPGKALRFNPDKDLLAVYINSLPEKEQELFRNYNIANNSPNSTYAYNNQGGKSDENSSFVWVKKGNQVTPVKVVTGISDGINTALISGLNLGDEVVTDMSSDIPLEKIKKESSPFMPKRPGSPNKPK
jgi:HlyD family secretion protein